MNNQPPSLSATCRWLGCKPGCRPSPMIVSWHARMKLQLSLARDLILIWELWRGQLTVAGGSCSELNMIEGAQQEWLAASGHHILLHCRGAQVSLVIGLGSLTRQFRRGYLARLLGIELIRGKQEVDSILSQKSPNQGYLLLYYVEHALTLTERYPGRSSKTSAGLCLSLMFITRSAL